MRFLTKGSRKKARWASPLTKENDKEERERTGRPLKRCFAPDVRRWPKNPSHARRVPSQPDPVGTLKTIGSAEIQAAIARLATAISERHAHARPLLLLGIANGGIELTCRLARQLAMVNPRRKIHAGTLDISFHRDDIGSHPIPKEFAPTHIPTDVQDAEVILVDDVLFTGRTAKAALNELFDHGRPSRVEFATLVDRGGRRLPFAADFTGIVLAVGDDNKVVVRLDPTSFKRDVIRVEDRPAVVVATAS